MTLIIITGGIDLSVGSIVGLTAIMLGVAWHNWGLPLEVAIVVALAIATACGSLQCLLHHASACPRSPPRWPRWPCSAVWPRASRRPLGARLPGVVLHPGPEGLPVLRQPRCVRTSSSWSSSASSASVPAWPGRRSVGRCTPSATTRRAPLQRPVRVRNKFIIYTLSGFMSGLAGLGLRVPREHDAADMGNGFELTAIRPSSSAAPASSAEVVRSSARSWPGSHPADEERPCARRRQG